MVESLYFTLRYLLNNYSLVQAGGAGGRADAGMAAVRGEGTGGGKTAGAGATGAVDASQEAVAVRTQGGRTAGVGSGGMAAAVAVDLEQGAFFNAIFLITLIGQLVLVWP